MNTPCVWVYSVIFSSLMSFTSHVFGWYLLTCIELRSVVDERY